MPKNDFLSHVSGVFKLNAVFQQDKAPAHYIREVRQFLDDEF